MALCKSLCSTNFMKVCSKKVYVQPSSCFGILNTFQLHKELSHNKFQIYAVKHQIDLWNGFQSNNIKYVSQFVSDEDYNKRALEELDITLLKPHPEWRNVAAGPVWGSGDEYYDLLWKEWIKLPANAKIKAEQDEEWKKYVSEYGVMPTDYLSSEAFHDLYQGNLTWVGYFRNRKGAIQKQKTRKTCIKGGKIITGSPCPLCRDEKLLMTYKNVPLLNEYIDHLTGEVHSSLRTGLCQNKQKRLKDSFRLAQELGYLPKSVPFVKFKMEEYRLNPRTL